MKTLSKAKKKTSQKSSKKLSATRKQTGKSAWDKGKKFEDQVAELYRLLGAKVVQNIEIHQKKVDILATYRIPGSSREHSVIVECKDESRSVAANQRVMAFKGLLDVARKDGRADSAEIITRKAWGDAAKGFAKTSGIDLFTYTEKVAQLIDFSSYLKALIEKFDTLDPGRPNDPPLGAYYVDLSAQRGSDKKVVHLPIIDTYIHEWLQNEKTGHQLAVFGDYGSGKSTLCQKLARDLASAYLNDPTSSRIPILLNLRDFIGKLDLEAYITSFLDRECRVVNPRIELFQVMNEAGIFLMIFDGFDEMAVKVDADTLESNLLEIEKLASGENSKAMLTSRPEYFVSAREETEALTPGINPFLSRATTYAPLKILPWDEKQVELFLRKRVPLVKAANQSWTYYRDQIKKISSLSDLSQRPVLLDMIVKTLPRLISSGETINLPSLYKSYLIGEMKRQKVLKKRSFLLSDDDRLHLLQELAIQIYVSQSQSVTFTDALKLVEKEIKPPKHELEAHTRDFLTNSFLIRTIDEYRLSHKSILEYLVAMKLNNEIQSNHSDMFGRLRLQYQVSNFIKEFDPDTSTLINWIDQTRQTAYGGGVYLAANAAEVLLRVSNQALAGRDVSGTNLSGVSFWNADLRGTNFDNTLLADARMTSTKLDRKGIQSARLQNTELSFYVLKTEDTQNLHLNQFMDFAEMKVGHSRLVYRTGERYRADVFWEVIVPVKDVGDIETIRNELSTALKARIAVYYDECEELVYEVDSQRTQESTS